MPRSFQLFRRNEVEVDPAAVADEKVMAFDGAMPMESERAFSLQTATVKVSTVLVLAAVAMVLWIGRRCFKKEDAEKKAVHSDGRRAMYGAL